MCTFDYQGLNSSPCLHLKLLTSDFEVQESDSHRLWSVAKLDIRVRAKELTK